MKEVSKENEKQFFDWTFEFGARKPVSNKKSKDGSRRTALTKSNLTKAEKEHILTNPHYVVISTLEEVNGRLQEVRL